MIVFWIVVGLVFITIGTATLAVLRFGGRYEQYNEEEFNRDLGIDNEEYDN